MSRRTQGGAGNRRRGAQLLEASLTSVILFTFLYLAIVLSLGAFSLIQIQHLAEEGTRWASVRPTATALDVERYIRSCVLGLDQSQLSVTVTFTPPVASLVGQDVVVARGTIHVTIVYLTLRADAESVMEDNTP